MLIAYPAVFRKLEDGTYRADFPDLVRCYAEGADMESCIDDAIESVRDFVTARLRDGEDLPKITDMETYELKEGEEWRNIGATIRLQDGYGE